MTPRFRFLAACPMHLADCGLISEGARLPVMDQGEADRIAEFL
jgi:hypothetical protein